jgi:molybdate transport system ATP-binding protein
LLRADFVSRQGDFELSAKFEVEAGTCATVTGPSGCGKTTLLRSLAGLIDAVDGLIECDGQAWLDTSSGINLPVERRRTGFVFQDYALFPKMTAIANVSYAMADLPRDRRQERSLGLLEQLGIAELAKRRPAALSGGERQRVALARALALRPRLLLLDEPFASLDQASLGPAFEATRRAIAEAGVPALLVTHDSATVKAVDGPCISFEGGCARIL